MPQNIIPVLISGGAGTRLWPLSTEATPKQFHAIGSEHTLFQQTALRLAYLGSPALAPPVVICSGHHRRMVEDQMEAIGSQPAAIILEPMGRNTAPVATVASLLAQASDPDALILLMPSDHVIRDAAAFGRAVLAAAPAARERIVLLGVVPTAPETGFGYIEVGEPIAGPVSAVIRFVEKPDLATAQAYLESGRHLWNAGIFLCSPQVLLAEMRAWAPDVLASCAAAVDRAKRDGVAIELDADAFAACPSISLDYAVMEKTAKAAVVSFDGGWSDIGSWSAIWSHGPQDAHGNLIHGEAALIDTEGCLIWSEGKSIGTIGLRDLIVVQTDEAVIVLPKSRAQEVKRLVELARAQRRELTA